ncbi:MAG: molecular chaperone DnaJ [Alphaproteobacteria bacterium]|nr:molecular chaperone DnaJ [Alphaproteobacteria bacterium]MDB5720816.1 molecular chaperone DnaJ [Alphaproteobacteria bacterium]
MGPIVLLVAGALIWAWWSGKLKGVTQDDMIAALVFLLGFVMLTRGKLLPGAALMAASLLWAAYRRRKLEPAPMPVEDARRLLGVGADATLEEIRAAHRRLIARVHPDIGGSQELANRVNIARDTLVAEMNRRTRRAS